MPIYSQVINWITPTLFLIWYFYEDKKYYMPSTSIFQRWPQQYMSPLLHDSLIMELTCFLIQTWEVELLGQFPQNCMLEASCEESGCRCGAVRQLTATAVSPDQASDTWETKPWTWHQLQPLSITTWVTSSQNCVFKLHFWVHRNSKRISSSIFKPPGLGMIDSTVIYI